MLESTLNVTLPRYSSALIVCTHVCVLNAALINGIPFSSNSFVVGANAAAAAAHCVGVFLLKYIRMRHTKWN